MFESAEKRRSSHRLEARSLGSGSPALGQHHSGAAGQRCRVQGPCRARGGNQHDNGQRETRLRDFRGPGRVRAGADPRAHHSRSRRGARTRPHGGPEICPHQGSGSPGPGCNGEEGDRGRGFVQGTRDYPANDLPVCGAGGEDSGVWEESAGEDGVVGEFGGVYSSGTASNLFL